MAQHRYRHRKIKREHTIIEGLLPVLEKISEIDAVQSITPGRINQRSRTGRPGLFFQYETETGLKLIGRSPTAVQEVFVVTDAPKDVLDALIAQGLIQGGNSKSGTSRGGNLKVGNPQAGGPESESFKGESSQGESVKGGKPKRGAPLSEAASKARSRGRRHGKAADREHTTNPSGQPEPNEQQAAPDAPPNDDPPKKVEPELWNELLRLHKELLDLEKQLGEAAPHRPASTASKAGWIDAGGTR